ncbi:MAG: PaaI family thioesterase, partial [Rhodospirillaceae bacterium]
RDDFVRPGGTVTGPAMFALADVALYGAVLSLIGRVELAVTTSMTVNFLRRPAPVAVVAEARILKLGKRLAYGEVMLWSEGEPEPVAHVTGTYSIPPHGPVTLAPPHYLAGGGD